MFMKRLSIFLIVFCLATTLFAGDKYFTRNGHIYIISATDIIDLAANNNQVACIVDIDTGEMVFTLLMKSFIFEEALAQDHFNDNYAESDKYPKSTFKGKITNISEIDLSKKGKYNVTVEGDLTMHGVTKKVKSTGTLEVKKDEIVGYAKFNIDIYDYKIKIPKIVKDRVNNIIPITVNLNLTPYKK